MDTLVGRRWPTKPDTALFVLSDQWLGFRRGVNLNAWLVSRA